MLLKRRVWLAPVGKHVLPQSIGAEDASDYLSTFTHAKVSENEQSQFNKHLIFLSQESFETKCLDFFLKPSASLVTIVISLATAVSEVFHQNESIPGLALHFIHPCLEANTFSAEKCISVEYSVHLENLVQKNIRCSFQEQIY